MPISCRLLAPFVMMCKKSSNMFKAMRYEEVHRRRVDIGKDQNIASPMIQRSPKYWLFRASEVTGGTTVVGL